MEKVVNELGMAYIDYLYYMTTVKFGSLTIFIMLAFCCFMYVVKRASEQ